MESQRCGSHQRGHRTLFGIQAYSTHFSFVLLSVNEFVFGFPAHVGYALMIVPQILPFMVAFFLAMADRSALRDVQI
jgi:hypothetical protein